MTEHLAKLHEGVWLPADEVHLTGMMSPGAKRFARLPDGRAAYQRHKYLAALEVTPGRAVFCDIGAHVGLWSMQAALDFASIVAFEPHPLHAGLYRRNCPDGQLTECALGDSDGSVALTSGAGSSGDTWVSGAGPIPMRTLDSFSLPVIDLLKIDTEGYELPILLGAVETLKHCRPVVVVEQKGRDERYHGQPAGAALHFLTGLGMKALRGPISGDHFLGWS